MAGARVLLADPPWLHGDQLPGPKRGATKHYPCLPTERLCAFELPPLDEDCILLMWRLASMQRDALAVCAAWGFRDHSELVWNKLTKTGKEWFGMGRIVRGSHETCLIGVRGRASRIVENHSIRSSFSAQVRDHSEKPDRIYEIAEALVPGGPWVELFARRRRAGWEQYGNQLEAA